MPKFILLDLAVLMLAATCVAQDTTRRVNDVQSFSEDIPFVSPVPLPDRVLQVLLQDEAVKEELSFADDSERRDPKGLFRATEVHLGGADETELLVIGVCPMCGADNAWFWLVRSAYKNPSVVLWAGGNSLELLGSRTHDMRDVRSLWSSASETKETIYHFNGSEYKEWQRKSMKNLP